MNLHRPMYLVSKDFHINIILMQDDVFVVWYWILWYTNTKEIVI
jgi:hypothetical protein